MPIVIDFPTRSLDEQAADLLLTSLFEKQRQMADLELAIAEMTYRARAIFIGGMCLPWSLLTKGQRAGYVLEAKSLIQKGRGE